MRIDVYKIGAQNYATTDKNGGMHEAKLIASALKDVKTTCKTLVIINGAFVNEKEEYDLFRRMCEYEIKIFILTDDFSFVRNNDIMEECDYILHQYPDKNLMNLSKINYYSWVPELFFKTTVSANVMKNQHKVLLYGGGVRDIDMATTLLEYSNVPEHVFKLKTEKYDHRLNYNDYNKLQRECAFSLIIGRSHYSKYGFVTPRFVEAINNWSYPIVDASYDISEHFMHNWCKVNNAEQAIRKMAMLSDTFERAARISEYALMLQETKDNFRKLIQELVK